MPLTKKIIICVTVAVILVSFFFVFVLDDLILLFIGLSFINLGWLTELWIIGELWLWIIIANASIAILFPITNFTRKFITKGIVFGIIKKLMSKVIFPNS